MTTYLITLCATLLTVTLASASCKRPVVEATVVSDRATIMPISPPEDIPHVSLDSCRERLVDVVRQARAYLGHSRPYLDVGPVEREVRMIGRDTLLRQMDTLLQECP